MLKIVLSPKASVATLLQDIFNGLPFIFYVKMLEFSGILIEFVCV